MGTYDVKWHAYEQAMKADPAWQKLSKAEKAEQFGRYAQGLQYDQIKAANKARGQELSIMIAQDRQAKQEMYENLFAQVDDVTTPKYNLVTDPAKVSASQIDEALGIGVDNHVLRGLNTDYRHLEALSDYKHALGDKLAKPTEFSPEILDDLTGHGVNKELDAMGDYYRALEKTDDVAGKINWGKIGKWAGIAALAVGAAALIGWGISKLCKKDEAAAEETKPEETKPEETVVITDTPEEVVEPTPVEPEVPVVPVPEEPEEPVAPVEPEEPTQPEIPTEYAVQRGDGIWHIAERHLKDKFANEPEKFENLTTSEKNKMITAETIRIAKLNNYELVEKEINGRKDIYPDPTLKPGDIVKV